MSELVGYEGDEQIKAADSGSIDAFGRWRVSQINSQLDLKQIHDALPLFYDTVEIGTGSATHLSPEARTKMTTAATSDAVIMQTFQRANYISGKSQQVIWTFDSFNIETNITKRVGYFTNTTAGSPYDTLKDGLWLESSGSEVTINISQSGTTTESTAQSSWNLDKLDGSGCSGINWDWSKNTILIVDFEWLGLGRVRWGVVYHGLIIYFHESNHVQATATGVYMSSPNQPIRAEIRQTGAGSGTFNYICATVGSEGSINKLGKILSDNLGTTTVTANSTASKYALIGIRLNSSKVDTLIDIVDFSILATTNDNQLIEVWLNPTVSGTFTYNAVTNSSAEIAKGSTNTVTGGTLLFSKYISAQSTEIVEIENAIRLGAAIDNTVDEIVVTANPLSSNSRVLGAISWRELS